MTANQTSFKKGNKASVGNSGRPKTFDPIIEAEALKEWAKKPDALCLRAFAPYRGYSSESMYKWEASCPEFLHAMNIARDLIGSRREEMLILQGNARPFERYATWYDNSLHIHEKGDKTFEAEVKAKLDAQTKATPEEKERHEQVMGQLKSLQDAQRSSARKRDENSSNKDNKSA